MPRLRKRFVLFFILSVLCPSHAVFAQSAEYIGQGLTFFQLLQAGGWVMAVILLISVAMVALGIFSFAYLKPQRFVPGATKKMIQEQIAKKRFREAFLLCDKKEVPVCRVLASGLKQVSLFSKHHLKDDSEIFSMEIFYLMENIRKVFESAGLREADRIRSLIQWFANIGVIAPMLGLLGTVLGMIRAFGAIAYKVETGKPVLLSSAISQAMVTTAGGLIIGIFCMMLFYYFTTRGSEIIGQLESSAEEVSEELEQALRKR